MTTTGGPRGPPRPAGAAGGAGVFLKIVNGGAIRNFASPWASDFHGPVMRPWASSKGAAERGTGSSRAHRACRRQVPTERLVYRPAMASTQVPPCTCAAEDRQNAGQETRSREATARLQAEAARLQERTALHERAKMNRECDHAIEKTRIECGSKMIEQIMASLPSIMECVRPTHAFSIFSSVGARTVVEPPCSALPDAGAGNAKTSDMTAIRAWRMTRPSSNTPSANV